MRKIPAAALLAALVLTACMKQAPYADADLLKNPLYAEYYYDDFVETMVAIELQDPQFIIDNPRMKEVLDEVRRTGLQKAQEATDAQDNGAKGHLISVEHTVMGEALHTGTALYLSPDFSVGPGPELHIYLSKDVDPRTNEAFPGPEDVDIGLLKTPYGAQEYVSPNLDVAAYRTLVIYDMMLKRMYAFAQLAR